MTVARAARPPTVRRYFTGISHRRDRRTAWPRTVRATP
jgi:hypothetical protein